MEKAIEGNSEEFVCKKPRLEDVPAAEDVGHHQDQDMDATAQKDIGEQTRWCADCEGQAGSKCCETHPGALMTFTAAYSAIVAKWVPAAQALKDAQAAVGAVQRALDRLQVAKNAHALQHLVIEVAGSWDKHEHGMMGGTARVALANGMPIPADQQDRLCAAFKGAEISIEEDTVVSCNVVEFPTDLVDTYLFPLCPDGLEGLELPKGAVLLHEIAGPCVFFYMRRCSAKEIAGSRLLGFVTEDSRGALAVERGWCEDRCKKTCIFCNGFFDASCYEAKFDDSVPAKK